MFIIYNFQSKIAQDMKKMENWFISNRKDKQTKPSMIQMLKVADKYLKNPFYDCI